jgi:hypothetical protein
MALKKNLTLTGLVVIETNFGTIKKGNENIIFDAYIKVDSVSANKESASVNVSFTNEQLKFNKQYVAPISVADGAKNFIAQAYEHLKTLPEFAGATDC